MENLKGKLPFRLVISNIFCFLDLLLKCKKIENESITYYDNEEKIHKKNYCEVFYGRFKLDKSRYIFLLYKYCELVRVKLDNYWPDKIVHPKIPINIKNIILRKVYLSGDYIKKLIINHDVVNIVQSFIKKGECSTFIKKDLTLLLYHEKHTHIREFDLFTRRV